MLFESVKNILDIFKMSVNNLNNNFFNRGFENVKKVYLFDMIFFPTAQALLRLERNFKVRERSDTIDGYERVIRVGGGGYKGL